MLRSICIYTEPACADTVATVLLTYTWARQNKSVCKTEDSSGLQTCCSRVASCSKLLTCFGAQRTISQFWQAQDSFKACMQLTFKTESMPNKPW